MTEKRRKYFAVVWKKDSEETGVHEHFYARGRDEACAYLNEKFGDKILVSLKDIEAAERPRWPSRLWTEVEGKRNRSKWRAKPGAGGPSTTSFDVTQGGVNFRTYINVDQYGNPYVGNVHPIR